MACLKKADAHTRAEDGGMAVVIAKHPCVVRTPNSFRYKMTVTPECTGCMVCIKHFECPALVLEPAAENSKRGKVKIDQELCVGCGVCVLTCKIGAITAMPIFRWEEDRQ
jgi:indolepyruvate ferredoxin oxidoreductase alpha subunit